MEKTEFQIKTNHKYLSSNPISAFLVNNFFSSIKGALKGISFESLIDVGCGEGVIFNLLKDEISNKHCLGIDIDPVHVEMSKVNAPFCQYEVGDIYNLPYNKDFELVMCLEVLEHLEYPEKALEQIEKTTSKYALISVPREPIWRMLNVSRGKYLKEFGNTPGHLNHWSRKGFCKLIENYFNIIEVKNPLPWTIILASKK